MVRQAGLTLIEMLVALLILASMMSLSSMAYSFYVTGFLDRDKQFNAGLQQVRRQLAWQDQLSAAFYYMIEVAPDMHRPYFQGDSNSIQWMSTTSMQQPGQPALARIELQDNQLTYCEALLSDYLPADLGVQQQSVCGYFKLPIEPIDALQIDYYSWPDFMQRYQAMHASDGSAGVAIMGPGWRDTHDGMSQQLLPEWVRLTINRQGEEQQLWVWLENNDHARFGFYGLSHSG